MAKNRKSKIKKKAFNLGARLFPIAKTLAAPVSFLEQISAKHRQTLGSSFTNAPTTQKLKILTNIVTGSVTGLNFFSSEIQVPQTLNPSGILNKWTSNGALMIVYGILGKEVNKMAGSNVIPVTDKIKSVGKQLIIGGGVGGFFDDPPLPAGGDGASSQQVGTRGLTPQITFQKSNNFTQPSRRSRGGGDSVESSF